MNHQISFETITSADGTEIAYEKSGQGEPVVLVHGTGLDHKFWEFTGVSQALEKNYSICAVERRGRGESGDAREYALEREVIDIAAVVDSIDKPVTLIGHSYGAICTLEAALQTLNIRSLILYEPAFTIFSGSPVVEELMAVINPLVEAGENEKAMTIALSAVGVPQSFLDKYKAAPEWKGVVDTAPTLPREYEEMIAYDFDASRFKEMSIPTLLLCGNESHQSLKDTSQTVAETLPNSNLIAMDGAAHFAMITDRDSFIEKILEFIPANGF